MRQMKLLLHDDRNVCCRLFMDQVGRIHRLNELMVCSSITYTYIICTMPPVIWGQLPFDLVAGTMLNMPWAGYMNCTSNS